MSSKTKKIQVDPESLRPVEQTVQRRPRVSEKIGYSGERFWSGNEEWMYSTILRDLLNNYEFQDKKIQVDPESLRLVEQFKDGHKFQRRLGTLENVFDREMKSECIQTYYVTC